LQGKKKNTLHNSYHHTKLSTCLLYYPRFSLQSLCFQFNLFS
jgi:hypothetical protein